MHPEWSLKDCKLRGHNQRSSKNLRECSGRKSSLSFYRIPMRSLWEIEHIDRMGRSSSLPGRTTISFPSTNHRRSIFRSARKLSLGNEAWLWHRCLQNLFLKALIGASVLLRDASCSLSLSTMPSRRHGKTPTEPITSEH